MWNRATRSQFGTTANKGFVIKGFVTRLERDNVVVFEVPGRNSTYTTAIHKCVVVRKNDEFIMGEIKKRLDHKRGLKVIEVAQADDKKDAKVEVTESDWNQSPDVVSIYSSIETMMSRMKKKLLILGYRFV